MTKHKYQNIVEVNCSSLNNNNNNNNNKGNNEDNTIRLKIEK